MRMKVRAPGVRLTLPVPVSLLRFIIHALPARLFEDSRTSVPEPFGALVTKELICMLLDECRDIIRENKGLEVVHVEAADGTFVSIKL